MIRYALLIHVEEPDPLRPRRGFGSYGTPAKANSRALKLAQKMDELGLAFENIEVIELYDKEDDAVRYVQDHMEDRS